MRKKQNKLPEFFINAFYESKFRDNLFIVKASGAVIEDEKARASLIRNIRELTLQGIKVILIYGGGKAMDDESARRGIDVKKIDGKRINGPENIDVLKHVVGGDLSLLVSSEIAKNGVSALSFNAIPSNWAEIALKPKCKGDDYTGALEKVYARPVRRLFKSADFIACACIGVTADGSVCNINADKIANALATGLMADKLIFMSNVDGVKVNGETAMMITSDEIQGLIDDGTVTDGMRVKMENCAEALNAGVKRIHLINGLRDNALHAEIFESVGPGTMLLKEEERENYMNEVNVQKAIGGK